MSDSYEQSDLKNQKSGQSCSGDISLSATATVKNTDQDFKFSASPNFEDIRNLVNEFAKERNWSKYHTPRNLLLAMVGEVGELAELFQWRGEVEEGLAEWTEDEKTHLGEELSDVLIYLLRLSEKCHIDLPTAVIRKISLNKQKYPAHKVWGSNKKYTEYE